MKEEGGEGMSEERKTRTVGYIGRSTNPNVLRIKLGGKSGWIIVKQLKRLLSSIAQGKATPRYVTIYEYTEPLGRRKKK